LVLSTKVKMDRQMERHFMFDLIPTLTSQFQN